MSITDENYLKKLFINEAKPALQSRVPPEAAEAYSMGYAAGESAATEFYEEELALVNNGGVV